MSALLSRVGLLAYIFAAAAVLAWWTPHFFALNLALTPHLGWRYLAASGVPLGLMLSILAARQSIQPRFSLTEWWCGLAGVLTAACALITFRDPVHAAFFSALHVLTCALVGAWHLGRYRNERREFDRRRAALAA